MLQATIKLCKYKRHFLIEGNIRQTKKGPICRECQLNSVRRYRAKKRALKPPVLKAYRTHCKHGHRLTYQNSYVNARGSLCCRRCTALAQRTYRAKNLDKIKAYNDAYRVRIQAVMSS